MIKEKSKKNIDKTDKNDWQPLRELALNTPYTMGYLSLMARRKQLKVKKIGRIWHSTMENIKDFEEQMRERKELRKKQLQDSYREKVKREVLKEIEDKNEEVLKPAYRSGRQVQDDTNRETQEYSEPEVAHHKLSADDTIFDEVQKELEEVLQEIRDREKKLRQDYLAYRGIHGNDGVEVYGNAALAREKQETEELSEKLIMDLGRLLNTANKIHEEEETVEPEERDEGIAIPIRSKGARHGSIKTMDMDFKKTEKHPGDISNPPAAHQPPACRTGRDGQGRAGNTHYHRHKDNFLTVPYSTFPFEHQKREEARSTSSQNGLLLFIAGLLVFIATILIVLVIFG